MLDRDICGSGNRRRKRQESRGENVARILSAARTLCAIYGSGKTNVSDIASYLEMSPANVYRFFPSKLALYDALVARVLEDTFPIMQSNSDRSTSAQALREFILGLHRGLYALMRDQEKLFELLTVADDERWPAFEAHALGVRDVVVELVQKGVLAKEFREQDSLRAAECLCASAAALLEPKAIKTFHFRRSLIRPEDLISFGVEALRNRPVSAGDYAAP
ncbi:TetR/AcrR family transcriptional regulator [Mesorhizobium sp. M1E.F.Ca.ET.063.01.1.1]|uniref:TetR/AcrR family transcriptional regulator n=1 Tax=Mesorhizobium sp. M1E.F.Ca.ET.063.01.1.1 TaxID=2496750 RepID=UPI000FCA9CBD|nr:TetR/AcrR family transcriptional regulator [Mesorhizobium sp. M1E.F.Ca.ET.063.01.1.1]RUW86122.1 TetR/AcrR family transcriptional regulator [Mesorhizobium sp. M1E.F.Ca.ET.063.01.1.1]